MAVTTRACIGRSTTTETSAASDKPCIITNLESAEPWFPSVPGEVSAAGNPTGPGVRTVEIFWFVNSTSVATDRIISCRDKVLGVLSPLVLIFASNTSISWVFTDAGGTDRTIATAITLTGNTGVWWHSVLYKDTNTDRWQARHGRVGLTVAGAPSTADTWAQYLVQITPTVQGIAGDDRMRGLRLTNTNQTFICMGGFISPLTGAAISNVTATSSLKGGYADLRIWSDNRGMIEAGTGDSPFDLRDQYIDGTQFPTLLHCFRFNEPNGTVVTGFDDVGVKNARFMSAVSPNPVGFASSPIPAAAFDVAARSGAYKVQTLPAPISRTGDYKVLRIFQEARDGAYKVRVLATPTRIGDYKVAASFSASRDGAYKVGTEATLFRNGQYAIAAAEIADTVQRTGEYRVQTAPTISRNGEYVVGQTPTISRIGEYKVLRSIGTESRTGAYKIANFPAPIARVGAYKVSTEASVSRTGEYRIVGQSDTFTIQRAGKYVVYNPDFAATLALRKQAELRSRTR